VWARGVKVSEFCFFLVIFLARCISTISPRVYFRKHTFCFLPLVTILESLLLYFSYFSKLWDHYSIFIYVYNILHSYLSLSPSVVPLALPISPHFTCCLFFFGHTGVWIHGFMFAKQALYHLSHISSRFCYGIFGDGVPQTIFPGWPWTLILPISASQIAWITRMSHQQLALHLVLLFVCF
jgi:hypothetical protein